MGIEKPPNSFGALPEEHQPAENQERKRVPECDYAEMVLSSVLDSEFSRRFSSEVLGTEKKLRPEALQNFKIDYINKKLRLAHVLQQTKQFFLAAAEPSLERFDQEVSLESLNNNEKREVAELAGEHIRHSQALYKFIFGEDCPPGEGADLDNADASALFYHLTGQLPVDEERISVQKLGDILQFELDADDFATLYTLEAKGEYKQRLHVEAQTLEGFFRPDCTLSFENDDGDDGEGVKITFQMIAVNNMRPDEFDDSTYQHEQQHVFHNMLYRQLPSPEKITTRDEVYQSLDGYMDSYLEQLRDEAIAHIQEGEQIESENTRPGSMYYYPDQLDLEDLHAKIGDDCFRNWQVERYWQTKIVPQYEHYTKQISKVCKKLAKHRGDDREKIIALFETEPPRQWRRLYKWLQDPIIQQKTGIALT